MDGDEFTVSGEDAARLARQSRSAGVARDEGRGRRRFVMRRSATGLALAAVAALAVFAAAGLLQVGGQPGHHVVDAAANRPLSGPAVPAPAVTRLRAIADRYVRGDGQASPDWASVVTTSHGRALAAAAPSEWAVAGIGNVTVYLVTIKGRFWPLPVSSPLPGHGPPTGKYLSIIVDATSFHVLYLGLGSRPPRVDPRSLGAVTYLTHLARPRPAGYSPSAAPGAHACAQDPPTSASC